MHGGFQRRTKLLSISVLDETNSEDAGVVPTRNHPFSFLRRRTLGRAVVGRDRRTDGVGKTGANGAKEIVRDRA